METYTLPYFPPPYRRTHLALFTDVSNAPEIRQRLISASTAQGPEGEEARRSVDYGFVDAAVITSKAHLLTALLATLLSSLSPATLCTPPSLPHSPPPPPSTRTHNLHSELLLALSPNNNISDALRRFGISDHTTSLLVVKIGGEASEEQVWKGMSGVVRGELAGLGKLGEEVDWGRVDKIYKLSDLNSSSPSHEEIRQRKTHAIINTISVKSVT